MLTRSSTMTNNNSSAAAITTKPAPPSLPNETLRERIVTGGGGTIAARGSLSKVATKYAAFLNSLSSSTSTDNNDGNNNNTSAAVAAALETELSLHDLEIRKLLLSSKASDCNSSQYTSTLTNMQHTLTSTQDDINSLSTQLTNEKQIKQYRYEYNALAKLMNDKLPPIHTSQIELSRIQNEINTVQQEVKGALLELHVREKQMRVFMACLGDLKSTLKEEDVKKQSSVSVSNNKKEVEGKLADEVKGTKRKRDDVANDNDGESDDSNDNIGAL